MNIYKFLRILVTYPYIHFVPPLLSTRHFDI